MAVVVSDAASDPAPGSVSANEAINSPVANLGRYLAFCSGVPSNKMPCEPIPTVVPNRERKHGEVWPMASMTMTSSSIVRARPPNSSGTVRPNKPIFFMSSTMSCGISSVSATWASAGTRRSRTKRLTVSSRTLSVSESRIINLGPFKGFLSQIGL